MRAKRVYVSAALLLLLSSCSDSVVDDIKSASENIEEGNYKTAVVLLKNAVSNDPQNYNARQMLGEAYLATGNYAASEKELEIVFKRAETVDDSVAEQLAMAMYRNESYTELQKLFSEYSGHGEGLKYYYALALRKLGDEGESNKILKANATSESKYSLLSGVILSLLAKDYAEALSQVNEAETAQVLSEEVSWLKVQVLTLSGDSLLATRELEKYTENKPDDLKATLLLAVEYIRSKQYDKAEPIVDSLYKKNSKSGLLSELKAYIALNNGDKESALPLLVSAYQSGRKSPGLSFEIAKIAFEIGQYETSHRFLSLIEDGYEKDRERINQLKLQVALRLGYTEEALKLYSPSSRYLNDAVAAELGYQLKRNGQPLLAFDVTQNYLSEKAKNDPFFQNVIGYIEGEEISLEGLYKSTKNAGEEIALLIATAIRKNDLENALTIAEDWAENAEAKDRALALEFAGFAAMKAGKTKRSDDYYSRLLLLEPSNISANLNALKKDIAQSNWSRVEPVVAKLLSESPHNEKLLKLLLDVQVANGDASEAFYYIKSHFEDRGDFRSSLLYAHTLFIQGNFSSVVEVLKKFSDQSVPDVNFIRLYTLSLSALGKIDQAVEFLNKKEKSYPDDGNVKMFLVFMLEAQGKFEEAENVVHQLIKMYPDDPRLIFARVELLIKNNEFSEAEKALASVPNELRNIDLYKLANGKVQLGRGQPLEAVNILSRAVDTNSRGTDVLYYAYALASVKKHEEAFDLLRKYLSREPNDIPVITALADGLKSTKPLESAALYRKLYDLDKDNLLALNNAAYLYMEGDDLVAAQELIDKVLVPKGNPPYLIDTAARLTVKLEGVESGNRLFESLIGDNPSGSLKELQCQYFSDTGQEERAQTCSSNYKQY